MLQIAVSSLQKVDRIYLGYQV
uniref:Uncharacterized protein n=1 Tax=Arundo donax TaxID=35708 RepID=A0A0A9AR17_ARUDO